MGLIAAAFGAAPRTGTVALIASLSHILSHSLFKSLLFLSVGAVIHLTGERNLERYSRNNPQRNPRPWLLAFFAVGALSIAGFPPFNGFVSKTLIGSLFKTSPLLGTALRLSAAGTAASMIKLSGMFRWRRKPRNAPIATHPDVRTPQLSYWCICSLSLLVLLCLAAGVTPHFMTAQVFAPSVGASRRISSNVYTVRNLAEAAATAAAGFLLYLLVRTPGVHRTLKRLEGLHLSLDGALLLVVAAVVLFAVAGGLGGGVFRIIIEGISGLYRTPIFR
jgi:formate hydrogenlyase subunit 3/multisubunit Na+/H+ antiporter MnhD subunit